MSKFSSIFLVGADYELENIFANIPLIDCFQNLSPHFRFKTTYDRRVLIVVTGFSKTNASAAAQFIIDHFGAELYINVGLVGAINSSLMVGDVFQVDECRFYDVDFTAFDYEIGQVPGTSVSSYKLRVIDSLSLPRYRLISGDRFVTNISVIPKEIERYRPDCVEVELASIAHVFYINNQLEKLSAIRTVSDRADSKSSVDFYGDSPKIFSKTNEIIKTHFFDTRSD